MKPAEVTIYNKPPFINEILDVIKPSALTAVEFRRLVKEAGIYDIHTMLTALTRQIDVSGLVPNLAGTCTTAQEVLKVYTDIAHRQLVKLCNLDPELQQEIRDTLTGVDFSLRALVILDGIQHEVISTLTAIRKASPLALEIRQAMEEALRELYRSPIKIKSLVFDQAISLDELDTQAHGVPRIAYPRLVVNGEVHEVWQYYHLPDLDMVHLPEHRGKLTAGQVLAQITPDFYVRDSKYDDHYDPESPVGFMGLLGKIGNALPRLIVEQVRRNSLLQERVMREEAISSSLYELFTRYPKAK